MRLNRMNARLLPAVWRKTMPLSFLYFHWLFPQSASETSPGNRSINKSTREMTDWEMEGPSDGLLSRYNHHSFNKSQADVEKNLDPKPTYTTEKLGPGIILAV